MGVDSGHLRHPVRLLDRLASGEDAKAMTVPMMIWFLAGLLAGTMHILLLWRAAQLPCHGITVMPLRMLGIAVLLMSAALLGELLPAACGWGSGFLVSAVGAYLWKAR
jgi:hypothetical protein